MYSFNRDFVYGARLLARMPGFAAAVVLILAVGIGATTAVFEAVDAVLLRPLPYKKPGRLVQVWAVAPRSGESQLRVSFAEYTAITSRTPLFQDAAIYRLAGMVLTEAVYPEEVRAAQVSTNLLRVLGAHVMLGRAFDEWDGRPGSERVAIIGNSLWHRHFAPSVDPVGKQVALDGKAFTVVGIMPPGFDFPEGSNLWIPWDATAADLSGAGNADAAIIARLRNGATLGGVQSQLDGIAKTRAGQHPGGDERRFRVVSLWRQTVGGAERGLLFTQAAVGLVLLAACANVAGLILVRGARRRRDVAIRIAVGATRMRIVRQLLMEGLLMSALGGIAGLGLAAGILNALRQVFPADVPRLATAHIDWSGFAFAVLVSFVVGLISSLAPALHAARVAPSATLKAGAESAVAPKTHRLLGRHGLLPTLQIGAATALAVIGGLLAKSFSRLSATPLGFDPRHTLLASIDLPVIRDADAQSHRLEFFRAVLARVARLPGVESAALCNTVPFSHDFMLVWFRTEVGSGASSELPQAELQVVSPNFQQTVGIPLMAGRYLADTDSADGPAVAVVNKALAQQFWRDGAIGKRIKLTWGGDREWRVVVGVVGDARDTSIADRPNCRIYIPYSQARSVPSLTLYIRTHPPPTALGTEVRKAVWEVDKEQPIEQLATTEELRQRSLVGALFRADLLAAFAGVGLLLAASGVYGTVSWAFAQRAHEIALRMALGASPGHAARLVFTQGAAMASVGTIAGLALSLSAGRLLSAFLFDVKAWDPQVLVVALLILWAVVLIACIRPALRVAMIDPAVALKSE